MSIDGIFILLYSLPRQLNKLLSSLIQSGGDTEDL